MAAALIRVNLRPLSTPDNEPQCMTAVKHTL
jgi:hypothetical protein